MDKLQADKLTEIRKRHEYDKALYAPKVLLSPPYKDREYLLQLVEKQSKALEFYARTDIYDYPEVGDYQVSDPEIYDDRGKLAREAIESITEA